MSFLVNNGYFSPFPGLILLDERVRWGGQVSSSLNVWGVPLEVFSPLLKVSTSPEGGRVFEIQRYGIPAGTPASPDATLRTLAVLDEVVRGDGSYKGKIRRISSRNFQGEWARFRGAMFRVDLIPPGRPLLLGGHPRCAPLDRGAGCRSWG